jgi:hypothetical protein
VDLECPLPPTPNVTPTPSLLLPTENELNFIAEKRLAQRVSLAAESDHTEKRSLLHVTLSVSTSVGQRRQTTLVDSAVTLDFVSLDYVTHMGFQMRESPTKTYMGLANGPSMIYALPTLWWVVYHRWTMN